MATLTVHNFLTKSPSRNIYCPAGLADSEDRSGELSPGTWRTDSPSNSVLPLQFPSTHHNASKDAKQVRELFKDYFCNEMLLSGSGTGASVYKKCLVLILF